MDEDDKEPLEFSSKERALAEKARWAEILPRQKSAYKPSGRISPLGWILLPTVGLVAGPVGAVAAGTIVASIGGFITSLSLHLPFSVILFPICALGTLCCLCAAAGFGTTWALGTLSLIVKNRNALLASAVGFVSGVIGAYVLCFAVLPSISSFLMPFLPALPKTVLVQGAGMDPVMIVLAHRTLGSVQNSGTALWTLFYLAAASSAVIAMLGSAESVTTKFCEGCQRYMTSRPLSFLSLDGARTLADSMKAGNLTRADVMNMDANGPAKVTVFDCGTCKAGYLEVVLAFVAKWTVPDKKKHETMAASWIVVSTSVTKEFIDELERGSETENHNTAKV